MSLHDQMDQLDRMLNDPDVPMQPDQVWALVAEISRKAGLVAPGRALGRAAPATSPSRGV